MMDFALVALLVAGAFWSGLYAPGQQLLLTAALALFALRKQAAVVATNLELIALILMAAGTALSLRAPAAWGVAAHGPVIVGGWMLAWAIGRAAAGNERFFRLLGRALALLGPLMVFGGVLGMSYLPVSHTGRLDSFLGYPIAVGVVGLMGLVGSLPYFAERRPWASLLLFGNGAALLLSGSRGVWAVAVLLALYLLWARPVLLRRVWLPLAWALAATVWAGPAIAQRQVVAAFVPLLLGSLTLLAIDWFRTARRRVPLWVLAGAAWLAVLALAPGWGWFMGRATALSLSEGSTVERMTFLRDGLRIARDLPLGAGFRAWSALHLQHASYDYYSAEVHSAPLDLALAFGWAGAAGFLLLLGRLLLTLRAGRSWTPERLALMAAVAALGLHSLADWDLSYGYFALLLWLGFGLAGPVAPPPAGPSLSGSPLAAAPAATPPRWRVPFTLTATVAALALAASVVLGAGDLFEQLAENALAAGRPQLAYRHALMATRVTPWNDLAQAMLGQAFTETGQTEAGLAALARARVLGPYEPWYAELQARTLLDAGRPAEAAAAYSDYVRLWPWQVSAYEEALQAHMDMLLRANILGDQALAERIVASGREILARLDAQVAKQPRKSPRAPMQVDTPIIRRARDEFGP